MNLVTESLKSAYNNIRQSIVDAIFDWIVKTKTRQTIRRCIQWNSKIYMIQKGNFSFVIFRRADLKAYQKAKLVPNNISFMELSEAAHFVAHPNIHNIKNYKRNGKKR